MTANVDDSFWRNTTITADNRFDLCPETSSSTSTTTEVQAETIRR
jgi:hypothetical protein